MKKAKTVTITMSFQTNEVYPEDDLGVLSENLFNFLNSRLVVESLSKKIKILGKPNLGSNISKALSDQYDVDIKISQEMIKSLKVKVV